MFRFTIRDVLWLTVVVALAVGWWGDRQQSRASTIRLEAEKRELEQQLRYATFDPMNW